MHDITQRVVRAAEEPERYSVRTEGLPKDEVVKLVRELEVQMDRAAHELAFEHAALLRDQIAELRASLSAADRARSQRPGRTRMRNA